MSALQLVVNELDGRLITHGTSIRLLQLNFGVQVYENNSNDNSVYVINKTPRYFFIIDFIARTYPDAKFTFLFRNPDDIIHSYVNTFNEKSWYAIDQYYIDFRWRFIKISEGNENSENTSYNNDIEQGSAFKHHRKWMNKINTYVALSTKNKSGKASNVLKEARIFERLSWKNHS